MPRVGIGYDVHSLERGRELWLGGVHFADADEGLSGHSDADVVAHAVCDALLGAAGLGDIGDHFPDTDPTWRGFPGKDFLARVASMVRDAGFEIGNVDCVVMSESVRLGPRKKEMAEAMAMYLGVENAFVNVKATTMEGHGPVGRGEIIACRAVALIENG